MPPKPSYVLKFNRAQEQLGEFESRVSDWRKNGAHAFALEPDPAEAGYFFLKGRAAPIPEETLAPIIGDAIQNLRASLDHLAFALAAKHAGSIGKEFAETCKFPIVPGDDPEVGKKQFLGRDLIKHDLVSEQAGAAIERLQPYHGERFRVPMRRNSFMVATNPLAVLNKLANVDKHRSLHVIWAIPAGVAWEPKITNGEIRKGKGARLTFYPVQSMERGTPIVRLPIRVFDPAREVTMDITDALEIAFREEPVSAEGVDEVLVVVSHFIAFRVFPELARFL